jgi:hypothetical protein
MMKHALVTLIGTGLTVSAQLLPPPLNLTHEETSILRGRVTDASNGAPIANLTMRVPMGLPGSQPRDVTAVTDEQGRYTLRGIAPGQYSVMAGSRSASEAAFGTRTVTLAPGAELEAFDFRLILKGSVSGKILDANEEPAVGFEVALIRREYNAGIIGYYVSNRTRTNDRGEYRISGVIPGAYLVLAHKRNMKLDPISEIPVDLERRRWISAPSYYPNSPAPEGGQPVRIIGGQETQHVDIRLNRSRSYCIEGLLSIDGRPAALEFFFHAAHPSYGIPAGGGLAGLPPRGKTGPNGRIRLCDLPSGEYHLSTWSGDVNRPDSYARSSVVITDRDVTGVSLVSEHPLSLAGSVVWDTPPEETPHRQVAVILDSLDRSFQSYSAAMAPLPGNFTIGPLLLDAYRVSLGRLPDGVYAKDIRYGSTSLLGDHLQLGSGMAGVGLQVVLAHDGGIVKGRVTDKEQKPIPDAKVFLLPKDIASERDVAARRIVMRSDHEGRYTSRALAPGSYYVFATHAPIDDLSPESVARLWRASAKAREVELGPCATVDMALQPVILE